MRANEQILPLPIDSVAKFDRGFVSRPMLSRDADSVYWMSRYVERAEHVARLLMVNSNLLTDVGDLAPHLQQRIWRSLLEIMRIGELPPSREPLARRICLSMTFDIENPSSLLSCITRARENARAIRENISAEMWENLNTLYWSVSGDEARTRFEENPDEFYRSVMIGSMLFQGLTDQTLPHDQRWLFAQIGKYLERVDVTCRIIETKYNILKSAEKMIETPVRNINWMAVLRSCCSIEAYRRHHTGDMDPLRLASFLILQRDFPRSVLFCVDKAHDAAAAIRASVSAVRAVDPTERILGRLAAQLEYAETAEIVAEGLPAYLQRVQHSIAEAALAMQKTYFLY